MSTASTVTGNTSKAIERHLSSSYQVVLYVAKNLDKIISNNNLMNHFAAFYLGGHTTPPTNTPSGDPLIAGGFYLNVNDNKLYFWAQVNGVFQWTDLNDVLVNVVTEFDAHAATVTTTFTELAEEYDTTFLTYLNDTQTYRNETDLMYQEILLMHAAVLQAYEHVLPLLNQIADIINQSSVYGGSIISDTPPNPPINSQRWTRCTDMKSFIWYEDGDGGQWVQDNPSMGATTHNDMPDVSLGDGSNHKASDIGRGDSTVEADMEAIEANIVSLTNDNTTLKNLRMVSTLSETISGLRPSAMNAIIKSSDTEYMYYTHLGGKTWQIGLLQNNGLDTEGRTTPFGWNQTVIEDISEAIVYGDTGVTQSGAWTDLSTFNAVPYYGHRAAQSTTVGNYIEISFNNTVDGASVSLIYNSRAEGNIVDVTIDGTTALLNEATTVDTYTATSLYRQTKLLASNLPAKSTPYVIRFTLSASKNPSASTAFNLFGFNGLKLSGGSFGLPWSDGARPKPFRASTPVNIYEEVTGKDGAVYVCTVAGTTGASAPSHVSGAASNGTATFLRLQQSSFILNAENSDKIQAQGSQLEYAYEFKKDGDSTFQDIGGNLHGNEYLSSGVKIYADGESRPITTGKFIIGSEIQFVQNIKAYYGTSPSHVDLADTVLVHSLTAGKVIVSHEHKFLLDGNFGYFYSAMWPQLAYNAVSFKKVFDTMNTPQFGDATLTDYAGVSNPIVGNTTDLQMTSVGEIYRPLGVAGVPSSGGGKFKILTRLKVSPSSVKNYQFSTTKAGIATNLNGAAGMTGYSSWATKKYFSRSNINTPEPILSGDVVKCEAEYSVSLIRKA